MQSNAPLSHDDAAILLQLLNRSAACTDEKDFHHLMCGMKTLIPYENAFTVFGSRGHLGDMTYHAVAINCPIRGQEGTSGSCDHHDAVMMKNFAQFPVRHWKDICHSDPHQKNIVSISYDAERNYGFTHDANDPGEMQGSVLSLSGRSVKRTKRTESILSLAVPHLHYALARALRRSHSRNHRLSPKEKEVINWLKQGKSTWDISTLQRISERTVKFHIANIMQKLNASNRAHAVMIAIEQGIDTIM
jgi:DNA-binding CsgD family transcriptional regulator